MKGKQFKDYGIIIFLSDNCNDDIHRVITHCKLHVYYYKK